MKIKKNIKVLRRQLKDLSEEREDIIVSASAAQTKLEWLDEWLHDNKRIVKLIELIPRAKGAEGEMAYITKGQYRKHWGREPKLVILTRDGKRVRWEYALDEFAQELGLEREYGSSADEALRDLIMLAKGYKAEKRQIEHDLMLVDEDMSSVGGKMDKVTLHLGKSEEVVDVQEGRTDRAKTIDKARQAHKVLRFPKVDAWLKHPERYDIKGVDTTNHKPRKIVHKHKRRAMTKPSIGTAR